MAIVTLKIKDSANAAIPVEVDTERMHETWIAKCLAYGIRRLPNDTYSSFKGDEKLDAIRVLVKEMTSGKEAPVKVTSGRAPSDPIEALATKNAKADLTAMFQALTNERKAIEMLKHEKVAPFYNVKDDRAIWNEETVKAWMKKQAESGKRDYMSDAKTALEAPAIVDELDF